MHDRRPHKRYTVDILDITSALIQANAVEIINISEKGIALCANRRLNIGERYILKIRAQDMALNLHGVVAWSRMSQVRDSHRGERVPVYTAGLEFIDLSNDQREALISFIEANKQEANTGRTPEADTRLSIRVRVDAPEEAFILDQAESQKVKQLSFSGARIQSKYPMKVNSNLPMMLSLSEDKFIIFQGRIASCLLIRDAYPKAYDIGIEFTELSAEGREMLVEFIRLLDTIDQSPAE
ncbi:MAG: PilZ domain-containing protein [Nitrospirota bacterium]